MDANAERALRLFRDKVTAFHRKRYNEGDLSAHLNLYDDVVHVLEKENDDILATLILLLGDAGAHDMRFYIISAMRGMGQRGKLSRDGAQALLREATSVGWWDRGEWYKTIDMLAVSSEGAEVLLEFAESRLLGARNILDWRWLAFFIVGAVSQRYALFIPISLKEKMKCELDQETDARQQTYFREVLGVI